MRNRPVSSRARLDAKVRSAARLASVLVLGALTAACSTSSPPATFDLSAPVPQGRAVVRGQVLVAEPLALQALSDQRILVKDASGSISALGEGQWADQLPRLVQSRLIETLENTAGIRSVARANSGVAGDVVLTTEIRAFQIAVPANEAVVEISAKLVNDRDARVLTGRLFQARVPVARVDAAHAAPALDQALSTVLADMARWVGGGRARIASDRTSPAG